LSCPGRLADLEALEGVVVPTTDPAKWEREEE